MKKIILFFLVLASMAFASMDDYIVAKSQKQVDESDVSKATIMKLIDKSGKTKVELDDDGDIFITDGKYNANIFVYPNQKLVTISAIWNDNISSDDEERICRLLNDFNENKILAKASFFRNDAGESRLRLRYNFVYNGGVKAVFLNETLEWFWILCNEFVKALNE